MPKILGFGAASAGEPTVTLATAHAAPRFSTGCCPFCPVKDAIGGDEYEPFGESRPDGWAA
ncbi:hypothetical protein GCM10027589_21600 [Actinocorallia lasiicapitis]